MQRLNAAAASALQAIDRRAVRAEVDRGADSSHGRPADAPSPRQDAPATGGWQGAGVASDVPSFTVEALPVETFEALLLAAPALGEVLDDDPPYRLDAYIGRPFECWCRLDVVPDAGSSTVSLTIGSIDGRPVPPVETIRDLWIVELNALDW